MRRSNGEVVLDLRREHPDLWKRVEAQAARTPAIYGGIDFTTMPERFTLSGAGTSLPREFVSKAPSLLADESRVGMLAAYTMMGDEVADAYAALIPQFGFRRLVSMLEVACEKGLDAVPDAPAELAAFVAAMERKPDWLDMELVREGARVERNQFAHLVPFAIRGAFIATFMNKYSALPMALTGALSNELAAKRVFETATFFTLTVMPGALDRHGEAFKAAAMVRLMHSMVRFNVMRSPGLWDSRVYGVPIPQVDQMPAGQIGSFLMAFRALREGRNEFTPAERARIEIARYRCFLLGLPEPLLGETPRAIADLMLTYLGTLRYEFDDVVCGALVRGTMTTELSRDPSLTGRINRLLERSFSKTYFVKNFVEGDFARAAAVGCATPRATRC